MRTHLLSVVVLAACSGSKAPPAPAVTEEPDPIEQSVADALDPSVSPCQDFYAYACGGWQAANPLPADKASMVRGFTLIADRNEALLHEILEGLAAQPPEDDVSGRLGRFYASCMDEEAIDARGAEPVQDTLALAEGASTQDPLATLGRLNLQVGSAVLFHGWAGPDDKNPELNILHVYQAPLGLPDRDYYLEDELGELRDAYRAYVQRLFELAGEPSDDAARHAEQVVTLETELARISVPREQLRDPSLTYNKLDRSGLAALTPSWSWDAYFQELGAPDVQQINVDTPSYFEALPAVIGGAEPEALRSLLRASVLRRAADHLSQDFRDASFDFYGRTLQGQQEQRPRWKVCVGRTDALLGELLGQLYVERAFPGESKAVALDMIGRIEAYFEESLPGLGWMDDTTREKALEKARAITNKIGYPDRWETYEGVEVGAGYWENRQSVLAWQIARELAKLEQPVDKSEWFMSPSTVNAYYNPSANEIAFPAGILQPPFYGVQQPMAMNFGAIGMVVGHEITHGFDDSGRSYDATGRLADWWEPEVVEAFEARAQCVDELYSGFEVQPGLFVNGKLTLGENIADLGGLKQSWAAWRAYAAEHGQPESYAGLTADQLFFVAYAQSWCAVTRPENEAMRVKTDPHSPPRFRVNGAVMNHPAFGETFACEVGDPMRPAETCEVW